MPLNIGGVTCTELVGSGVMDFNPNEISAERWLKCAWDDRQALCRALMGEEVGDGGVIIHGDPLPFPDNPSLVCRGARAVPFSEQDQLQAPGDMIRYTWAKVIARYSTRGASAGTNGGQGEEAWDFAGEYITLPVKGLGAGGAALPEDFPLGKLLPQAQYSFTRMRLTEIPLNLIYPRLGKVNSTDFLGADEERVLFLGGRARRAYDGGGRPSWEVEYRFAVRPESWNKVFIPGSGWQYIYNQNAVGFPLVPIYESIDLRPLLAAP